MWLGCRGLGWQWGCSRVGSYLLIVDLHVGRTESNIRPVALALLQEPGKGALHQTPKAGLHLALTLQGTAMGCLL